MSRLDDIEARLAGYDDYDAVDGLAERDLRYLLNVARAAEGVAKHVHLRNVDALRAALEAKPMTTPANVARLAALVHYGCVYVDGEAALRHKPEDHIPALTWAVEQAPTLMDGEPQCDGYAGDPGASAPRCESYRGHPGRHFIRFDGQLVREDAVRQYREALAKIRRTQDALREQLKARKP